MLALFVCWLVIFHASRALGSRLTKGVFESADEWFPAFWSGFLILSSAALLVACYFPLTPWVAVALLLPPILLWRKAPIAPWYLWPVLAAMTYTSSSAERLYDTALYHRQLIDWMARDGLVPGLGILHYRLGFTSSWLSWPAMFDHGSFHGRMGTVASGLALATLIAHWIQRSQSVRTIADRFFLVTAPLLSAYFFFESMIVSPSPNLGAACAVFAVLWMLLVPGAGRVAALAAGAAATIKISAAILIPVALWRARRAALTVLFLAAPLLVANWRTTGCPLFPSPIACTESAQSLGAKTARYVEFETRNWARYAGPYPGDAKFWSLDWFPRWFSIERKRWELGIVVVSLLLIVVRRQWDACSIAAIAGSAYIYALAPDARFGIGFLLALPGRALAAFDWRIPAISPALATTIAALLLTVGARTGEHYSNRTMPDSRLAWRNDRLWRPTLAWSPKRPGTVNRDGLAISIPGSDFDRCGAVPRPCAPVYGPREGIRLCDPGRGFRGGFCLPR